METYYLKYVQEKENRQMGIYHLLSLTFTFFKVDGLHVFFKRGFFFSLTLFQNRIFECGSGLSEKRGD